MKIKMRRKRTNTYRVYKIPGRVGAVPKTALESGDINKLKPYLTTLHKQVRLPAVTNSRFAAAFERIAGCFPDPRIADKSRWKDKGIWIICSIGQPCWVVEKI